jgi:hypothetical protein
MLFSDKKLASTHPGSFASSAFPWLGVPMGDNHGIAVPKQKAPQVLDLRGF